MSWPKVSILLRTYLRGSKIHTKLLTVSHQSPIFHLACQVSSVQPHSACLLQQSSLFRALCVKTTASYCCRAQQFWVQSFGRREAELTSAFASTLQGQLITLRSLYRKQFSVANFMAQVFVACSMPHYIPHIF